MTRIHTSPKPVTLKIRRVCQWRLDVVVFGLVIHHRLARWTLVIVRFKLLVVIHEQNGIRSPGKNQKMDAKKKGAVLRDGKRWMEPGSTWISWKGVGFIILDKVIIRLKGGVSQHKQQKIYEESFWKRGRLSEVAVEMSELQTVVKRIWNSRGQSRGIYPKNERKL